MKAEAIKGSRIACYDNGGKTMDRYTVVYLNEMEGRPDLPLHRGNLFAAVGMNEVPFHPQGFGQHCTAMPGPHLGKRIRFSALPEDCRKLVMQDLTEVPR